MIAGVAFGFCSLSTASAQEDAKQSNVKAIITTKAIRQEIDFKAEPNQVYEALLDSKQFPRRSTVDSSLCPGVFTQTREQADAKRPRDRQTASAIHMLAEIPIQPCFVVQGQTVT